MMTNYNSEIPDILITKYLEGLVGQIYKILPIRETEPQTLNRYVKSLQRELLGCKELISAFETDSSFLSLLSVLEFLSGKDIPTDVVRSEVFKSISICKKLQSRYKHREG